MVERLGRGARATIRRAQLRARAEGARTVEAADLLLALVEAPSGPAGTVLADLGIDQGVVREGLRREFESALGAVGVHDAVPPRPMPPGSRRAPFPKWGESAKLALKRALEEAIRRGERPLANEHLLRAIVNAEAGVIPRLLEQLEVTPAQVHAALG